MVRPHKQLMVWQESMALVEQVYLLTASFPGDERFGLISQLRRAAVSIPSNIAEGAARRSSKEYLQFLAMARGSLSEMDTQLELSARLGFIAGDHAVFRQMDQTGRLLSALIVSIRNKIQS